MIFTVLCRLSKTLPAARKKFPDLICRAISAQFMTDDRIAMFELMLVDGEVKVVDEKHYQLVSASAISRSDLRQYGNAVV